MKWILGSGLAGLLTRAILGNEYRLIPMAKSRLYSYNPALADNYLSQDERYEDFLVNLGYDVSKVVLYRKGFSLGGDIVKEAPEQVKEAWLGKLFNHEPPGHLNLVVNKRMNTTVYAGVRLNELYGKLQERYKSEINEQLKSGDVRSISDGQIQFSTGYRDYSKIVSTIPLPALDSLCGVQATRKGFDASFLHVSTSDLNFEGFNQLLVVDENIPFYKCTQIGPDRYLFYFKGDLENSGLVLMPFLKSYDIIDGTLINNYIPADSLDHLKYYESKQIECLGTYGRWDFAMDGPSTLLHIMRLKA
jgi:hypothetical protein